MSRTFQHVKLVPDMTVLENVAMGTYLRTRCGAPVPLSAIRAALDAGAPTAATP